MNFSDLPNEPPSFQKASTEPHPHTPEPTIDWLIDQLAPNAGNSPLVNFNKERLRKLVAKRELEGRIAELEGVYGPDGDEYMWTDVDESDVNKKVLDRLAELREELGKYE